MGGHCSTISSALDNFSGSKTERQQSVDGCVLCSITALTDMGRAGSRREEIKWFNLGWVLKSLRERVVKEIRGGMCCLHGLCCSFFKMNECLNLSVEDATLTAENPPVRHRDNFSVGSGNLVLISHRDPLQRLSLILHQRLLQAETAALIS